MKFASVLIGYPRGICNESSKLKGLQFYFPENFRSTLTYFESENFSDFSFFHIFESESFRFPFFFFSQPSENRRKLILSNASLSEQTFFRKVLGCPWTVLPLFYRLWRPWFWLSTRTSPVAELDFHLVAFKRNLCFVVLCRGQNRSILLNICVEDRKFLFSYWLLNATNYVAHSLLRVRSVHFDPLLLTRNVFLERISWKF